MKYKKTWLPFILSTLLYIPLNAQLHYKGRIDTSIFSSRSGCTLIMDFYGKTFIQGMKILSVQYRTTLGHDGSFDITLSKKYESKNHGFVSFRISTPRSDLPITGKSVFLRLDEVYPVSNGDDISMCVDSLRNILFRGKGALKYNCAAAMYRMKTSADLQMEKVMLQNKHYHDYYLAEELRMDTEIAHKTHFLNQYKKRLGQSLYRQLCLDAIATTLYDFVRPMSWAASLADAFQKIGENKLFLKNYIPKYIKIASSMEMVHAAYYADFLFELEKLRFEVAAIPNKDSSRWKSGKIDFPILCKRISQDYPGIVKDKLLVMAFLGLPDVESKPYVAWALNEIHKPYFRSTIDQYAERYKSAYPFSLPDEHGSLHHLSDYKGKVLIIDYWFTGCKWCSVLHTAMHAITEKYKCNKQVVFLTINVDKDSKTWEKSLAMNAYSSNEYTNLFTEGMGVDHPSVSVYGYTGFPQILLIGAAGEVIASRPPRPQFNDLLKDMKSMNGTFVFNDSSVLQNENTHAFINIIDDYLNTHSLE